MNRRELLATCSLVSAFGLAGCTAPSTGPRTQEEVSTTDPPVTDGVVRDDASRPVETVREWPMFLYDGTNGRCFDSREEPATEAFARWSFETDDAIWGSPVVADGTLYVGSYDGHMYAISLETGELRWRYETGDRIDGSPAVTDDTVYFGSFDRNVYALDAETGDERWVYGTKGIVRSSPTVQGERLYIGAHCRIEECKKYYRVKWPERGYLYAFDRTDGTLLWRHPTGDGVISTPAVDGNTVYVGSSDDSVYAVDASTGKPRWRFGTDDSIMSSPTYVEGRIYLGNVGGSVYALDADTGDLQWRFDATTRIAEQTSRDEVVTGSPVVCDGRLYFGSIVPEPGDELYGKLYALSAADGTREWSESPFAHAIGSSPVAVDGVVYFGAHNLGPSSSAEPGVFALEADGTERWSYTVDGQTHMGFGSSPAVVGTTMYIGGADGRIRAFGLDGGRPEEVQ